MESIKFMRRGEILLGGFHAGSDIGKRWERFEYEEKIAKLTNIVNGGGFERRIYSQNGIQIFTGVEVTDKNILPNWELLTIPPAFYLIFEINCNVDAESEIDQQFDEIGKWLDDHGDKYKKVKWDNGNEDYMIIWSGRYTAEKICEIWAPIEDMTEG